jgi:hypothetical protein
MYFSFFLQYFPNIQKELLNWIWWCTPVIPALWRLRSTWITWQVQGHSGLNIQTLSQTKTKTNNPLPENSFSFVVKKNNRKQKK